MEKLNEYLQSLLSSCSHELKLEPNRNPYLIAANGQSDLGNAPLLGTQISMMVFPLIPSDVKMQLPNQNEIEFVHPHNLGKFNFNVRKSPAGFIVTVRPMLSDGPSTQADLVKGVAEAPSALAPSPEVQVTYNTPESPYELESTSANSLNAPAIETSYTPEIVEESLDYETSTYGYDQSQIEVVPANDPQFQTTFSAESTYEPPGKRQDFEVADNSAPEFNSYNEPQTVFQNYYEESPNPQNSGAQTSAPEPQPQFQQQFVPPAYQSQQFPQYSQPAEAAFVPARSNPQAKARMDALFQSMSRIGASDLHMSVSMPPMVRKDGKMQVLQSDEQNLTAETIRELLTSIMPVKNQEEFNSRNDSDFAYEIPDLARFRANIFMDRKGMGGVFRIIPTKILTAQQLGLSPAIMNLCDLSKGLVVVTGPTGSGKSTTLCAMIDHVNKTRDDHIITIEDPIEFVHDNQKCLVNQREVHNHTDSFKDALRAALREDPDILLVGEMRDLETISIAIETAETGHLVFGTLHTTTAASTVDRIIDQFPADRQQQIRVMLSESLKGVIAQTLLPKKGGGRVAALEVLIVTPAISNLIREGKTFQIPSAMQTGKNHGMVMLNDALFAHVQGGLVEPRDAYIKAVDKTGFETMLTRGGFKI
jgi:twitching motility protein PilT